jgi:tetratricopeptide (TPR) repeat protein
VDQANEKGLSALGGLLIKTFRYEKGFEVLNDASRLYPQGANFWYNQYRMAKCLEKMDRISEALKLLDNLYVNDIHALDNRVPPRDVLKLRIDKLQEVHGLGEIQ